MRQIPRNYNKSDNGIRYSWPLKSSEIYKNENLALSLIALNWKQLDMIKGLIDRIPDEIGLYLIIGSISKLATQANIKPHKLNTLINSLNCVLYVGQGKINDRFKKHLKNPEGEMMSNGYKIYKPTFHYILTKNINLEHLNYHTFDLKTRTEIFETSLIEFFGPPINQQHGRNIEKLLSNDSNIFNNKIKINIKNSNSNKLR